MIRSVDEHNAAEAARHREAARVAKKKAKGSKAPKKKNVDSGASDAPEEDTP